MDIEKLIAAAFITAAVGLMAAVIYTAHNTGKQITYTAPNNPSLPETPTTPPRPSTPKRTAPDRAPAIRSCIIDGIRAYDNTGTLCPPHHSERR